MQRLADPFTNASNGNPHIPIVLRVGSLVQNGRKSLQGALPRPALPRPAPPRPRPAPCFYFVCRASAVPAATASTIHDLTFRSSIAADASAISPGFRRRFLCRCSHRVHRLHLHLTADDTTGRRTPDGWLEFSERVNDGKSSFLMYLRFDRLRLKPWPLMSVTHDPCFSTRKVSLPTAIDPQGQCCTPPAQHTFNPTLNPSLPL